MAVVIYPPVRGPRIIPINSPTLPTDVLPDGHRGFRITQTFSNPDWYWTQHGKPNAIHGALDMGDGRCGDDVIASLDGKAITGVDNAGAKYIIIDHGNKVITKYWHLNNWKIPTGKWVPVKRGQTIGIVGMTGLAPACHLHFELWIGGVRVDPWKYLIQNNPQESTMKFGGADLVNDPANFTAFSGARVRKTPSLSGDVITSLGKDESFSSGAKVRGDSWTNTIDGKKYTSSWWRQGYIYDNEKAKAYVEGFVHELALNRVQVAKDPRLDRIVVALEGVVNALEAALSAVKNAISSAKGN